MKLFTSEAVGQGHPDIIADTISDSILDLCLSKNRNARVAAETLVVGNKAIVAGEISGAEITNGEMYNTILEVVENNHSEGMRDFTPEKFEVEILFRQQSQDIAMGVDTGGAGDQGLMFGFSCNYNEDMLPTPIFLARRVANWLTTKNPLSVLGIYKDVKTQFTLEYDEQTKTFGRVRNVVCSIHHGTEWDMNQLRTVLKKNIISLVHGLYPEGNIEELEPERWHLNATGAFTIGGPDADTGLTGRKLIAGTYGGFAHHGGGALSGKDPSKVDRSAALYLRWLANRIVREEKLANLIELQVGYAIGVAEPMSVSLIQVDMPENTSKIEEFLMSQDYTPNGMIEQLSLKDQRYSQAAMYGHFGKQPNGSVYTWENVNV